MVESTLKGHYLKKTACIKSSSGDLYIQRQALNKILLKAIEKSLMNDSYLWGRFTLGNIN